MVHATSLRTLAVLLLLILVSSCSSDTVTSPPTTTTGKGSIFGTISDSANGVGIAHVSMTIVPSLRTAKTDTNGLFEVDSLAVGTYYITLTKAPYRTLVDSVVVVANQLVKFNRTLAKPHDSVAIIDSNQGKKIVGWKPVQSVTLQNLNAVSYVDSLTVIAVGTKGAILRSTDGGATWAPRNSGIGAELFSVQFVSPALGLAVGDSGYILRSIDRGLTWTTVYYNQNAKLHGVSFHSSTEAIAAGSYFGPGFAVMSLDGGANWSATAGSFGGHGVWAVNWRGGDTILAGGETGRYWRSFDRGATWEQNAFGTTQFFSITFNGPQTGIMVGQGGTLYSTTNGGQLWNGPAATTSESLLGSAFASARLGFCVGTNGAIITSTTGLSGWTTVTSPVSVNLRGVDMFDERHGVIVGDGGVILTPILQ